MQKYLFYSNLTWITFFYINKIDLLTFCSQEWNNYVFILLFIIILDKENSVFV